MINLQNNLDIVILDYERDSDKDSYSIDGDIHRYKNIFPSSNILTEKYYGCELHKNQQRKYNEDLKMFPEH